VKSFELEEITISELQDGMKSGKFTARSLVAKYSARIDEVDKPAVDKRGPAVNAIIEMNPEALAIADALDQGAGASRCRAACGRHVHDGCVSRISECLNEPAGSGAASRQMLQHRLAAAYRRHPRACATRPRLPIGGMPAAAMDTRLRRSVALVN